MVNICDDIIAYESGELNHEQVVALFQRLIDHDIISQLQGTYQRIANVLVKSGECVRKNAAIHS